MNRTPPTARPTWSARRHIAVPATAALLAVLLFQPSVCHAVLVAAGNGNTDAASLVAASGPGAGGTPGFSNVGINSPGSASVVYLGNGWILTAAHVNTDPGVGPIRFVTGNFFADTSTETPLRNPDNTLADLKLLRLVGDPMLPNITASLISTSTPSGQVVMIGNGKSRGAQRYWTVVANVWTETTAPAMPTVNDFSGFDVLEPPVIRWGANEVNGVAIVNNTTLGLKTTAFTTRFDDLLYTHTTPLANEAQGTVGDSGGAGFVFTGGMWKLAGIMIGKDMPLTNQPAGTILFGDRTYFADLSVYRGQIIAIVPEPAGIVLAGVVLAGLGLSSVRGLARRRRKA